MILPTCEIPQTCPPQPLVLSEVLTHFHREAQLGICDTGRYRCRYYTWGEGPPLVLIHGMADDATSFVLPMARLSEHFQCIAYDLPSGNGDGARLGAYRHTHYVEDLYALMEHLGLQQTYLFGSSFGSTIALAAMYQIPDKFPRAVLQGAFAHRPLTWSEVILAQLARYWPGAMRDLPFRECLLQQVHLAAFSHCAAEIWNYYLERNSEPRISAVARRGLIVNRLDLRPLLSKICQPILLVCGSHDPLVGKACEADLLQGLPNVQRIEFDNCGHLPYFTHPEMLAEVILRFLTPLPCHR